MARSFIALYMDTARRIAIFKSLLGKVAVNLTLNNGNPLPNVVFGWRQAIDEVNEAYSELCVNFEHLRAWLEVNGEHLSNSDRISHVVNEIESAFIHRASNLDNLWLVFQATIAGIQARNKPDPELYAAVNEPLQVKMDGVWTELKAEVKAVEKQLLGADKIHLS